MSVCACLCVLVCAEAQCGIGVVVVVTADHQGCLLHPRISAGSLYPSGTAPLCLNCTVLQCVADSAEPCVVGPQTSSLH